LSEALEGVEDQPAFAGAICTCSTFTLEGK
jgi:hypothetical protein